MPEESEFTPSTEWCRKPHYWHADDADATEHEVSELVGAFVRALQPDLVVETGSHIGCTSKQIGLALKANGHGELVTIEFDQTNAARAKHRCRDLPVHVLHGDSLLWRPPEGKTVDFGWFDSDAHIRHIEIQQLLPHFSPGAIIGIHDTGPQHPVDGYLYPLVQRGCITPIRLRTPRGVTFAQVHGVR